jgi:cold shock CspA family protein
MRIEGTLEKWNDARGFGFIKPRHGGQDIFVHVSVFPRDGKPPEIGESLLFEIELDKDGRKRAVRVARPGLSVAPMAPVRRPERSRQAPHAPRHSRPARPERRSSLGRAVPLLILVVVAVFGYQKYAHRLSGGDNWQVVDEPAGVQRVVPRSAPAAQSSFRCDGRQHCSQMHSCAEAEYFLRNCPSVKMDGDGDGEPCERGPC